jgi:hypothetical protein
MNDVTLNWKKLSKFKGKRRLAVEDRPYTKEQIDLLLKIKNMCFLTPELAPTFAAKDDDLLQILGIMTRILDGNGYESDSGAQGHRGAHCSFI